MFRAGRSAEASASGIGLPAWLGLAYVSVFSMLVGFVFWYRGLALGGMLVALGGRQKVVAAPDAG